MHPARIDAGSKPPPTPPREYRDIAALLKNEMGGFERVYVTPQPSPTNPYLLRLYAPYLEPDLGVVKFLASHQALLPWARRFFLGEKAAWNQHWFQFSTFPTFVRANFRLLASVLFAWSNGRILWTIHNEQPHSGRFVGLNQWYCRQLARFTHRFHVHHAKAAETLRRQYGAGPEKIVVLPHPAYRTHPVPPGVARAGLEKSYGVPDDGRKLLLMFGFIAPYKGVEEVLAVLDRLRPQNFLLLVAGPVAPAERPYVDALKARADNPAVLILDRFIPDEDVNLFLCAADKVVFNHRRSLTSGAMQLASDYGRPILAPNVDAIAAFPAGTVETFASPEDLEERLRALEASG